MLSRETQHRGSFDRKSSTVKAKGHPRYVTKISSTNMVQQKGIQVTNKRKWTNMFLEEVYSQRVESGLGMSQVTFSSAALKNSEISPLQSWLLWTILTSRHSGPPKTALQTFASSLYLSSCGYKCSGLTEQQIGTPTASVSREVADVQRLMQKSDLVYSMHSAGTTVGK